MIEGIKHRFEKDPKLKNRIIIMILGVIIQGLGLSLLLLVNLGVDPCSCLTLGVINYLPISFGTAQVLCHMVTFVFVLIYDRSKIGLGTVGNMCCLGYTCDFFSWIWKMIIPIDIFGKSYMQWICLVPALLVFVSGAAAYMTADLGMSPYDAIPFMLSKRFSQISFKYIRIMWDVGFMVAGFILGGPVGVVTVLVAFCLGPVIAWFQKKLEKFVK